MATQRKVSKAKARKKPRAKGNNEKPPVKDYWQLLDYRTYLHNAKRWVALCVVPACSGQALTCEQSSTGWATNRLRPPCGTWPQPKTSMTASTKSKSPASSNPHEPRNTPPPSPQPPHLPMRHRHPRRHPQTPHRQQTHPQELGGAATNHLKLPF